MKISSNEELVQRVIQKIVDMPAEKVAKVLIFMAGMDAEKAINPIEEKKEVVLQT